MSLYYNNEKTENNEYLKMVDQFYKKQSIKNKVISMSLKKYMPNEKDLKIEKFIKDFLLENEITGNNILTIPLNPKYPFDGELYSYAIQKEYKNENDFLYLIYFLKFYDSFNNLLVKINNEEEKTFLFGQIVNKIKIEEKEEKDILFKLGENPEKFYFLLNGSVTRLIPYKYEYVMDKHEYFIYLKYIYKLDEIELFNMILQENEESFNKGEVIHFILGDKNMKFQGEALNQMRNMEKSYVAKLFDNNFNENNFNNKKCIILSKNKKTYDDIVKGDYYASCLDEHIKKIKVPIDEYINNLKPIYFKEKNEDLVKKSINLYTYKIDKEIKVGEHLEELEEKSNKRVSTIICDTNCIFGYFLKNEYYDCIKITQTKFHKNDINFLLQNELFSNLNFREFDKNYYHLFELVKKYQNQKLFIQGEINDYIYFIKQGEVTVSFDGNINDIYRIIALRGGPKNKKELDINYLKRYFSTDLDNNIFLENKCFDLFRINENFPIGLEDYLDEENDNKELFNVFCNMDSEVLAIKKEDFDFIIYKESQIKKVKEKYLLKRNDLLIEKLNTLKNSLIQKYILEKYKIKAILPELNDEVSLFSKKKKKLEKKTIFLSPKRKNDLSYIDNKLNPKSYREITSALRQKEQGMEQENDEQSEEQKNDYNKENSNINIDNNQNNKSNDYDSSINENTKNDNNNINNNDIKSMNKPKKRKSIILKSIRFKNSPLKNESKQNEEILKLLSQKSNQVISTHKNKKSELDPLDKIYKDLKGPLISNSKSIKNYDNIKNNNGGYYITSFKVFSPIKPHRFMPKERKIILPQKPIFGFLSKKMKEIKVPKAISQDKSSVILKTDKNLHDLYYDKNNKLISTLNFHKNMDIKNNSIFNNIKVNNSFDYKIIKNLGKKHTGIITDNINERNSEYRNSLIFPKIFNNSINRNLNNI